MAGRSDIPSADEALAGMARIGAPRKPMGTDVAKTAVNVSGAPSSHTHPVPDKNGKGGDPALGPTNHRSRIAAERLGAKYTVSANVPAPVCPEAGPTQANGRIVKNSAPGFSDERRYANGV